MATLSMVFQLAREAEKHWRKLIGKKTPHYVFSGLPPTSDIKAADKREEFARQVQREMKIPLPRNNDDWGDLFWHLAQQTQKGKVVLVLDQLDGIKGSDLSRKA
jgi:hypothetical protein